MQFVPLNVLVVDDDATNREVVQVILAAEGHGVWQAGSGVEALAIADGALPFDVVVMDLHMPEMDGLEATRRLRDGDATRELAILIVTGDTHREVEHHVRQAGGDHLIRKPIRRRAFLEALAHTLSRRGRLGEAETIQRV